MTTEDGRVLVNMSNEGLIRLKKRKQVVRTARKPVNSMDNCGKNPRKIMVMAK